MRKIVGVLIVIIIIFIAVGCSESDGTKFKREYESLNGQKVVNTNNVYRSLSIPKNNKIIYKKDSEIIDVIKNETAVIYFGFNTCPWCRGMIENFIRVVDDLNIEHVYYVDVKDIRDTLEVEDSGNIVRTKSGSPSYNELLDLLDEYLDYYTIYDQNNKEVVTKEKRLYAPSVIAVSEGKVLGLTTGLSDNLSDPFGEINDATNQEGYKALYDLIVKIKPSNVCNSHGGC